MPAEEKKRNDFFFRLSKNNDAKKAVDSKLNRIFGMSYNPNSDLKLKEVVECLKYNSITMLLALAPTDNYKQYKISNGVMLNEQTMVYSYGVNSRQLAEKFTDAVKYLGKDIKEEEIISVYGTDATYQYMTEELCWPILKELLEKKLLADPQAVNVIYLHKLMKMHYTMIKYALLVP